jgi:hypothetical protein
LRAISDRPNVNANRRPPLYPTAVRQQPHVEPYPGFHGGIDLRKVVDSFLEQYGVWMLLRHYDTTTHSQYWDDETQEAVGGPAYAYTDHIVLSRKMIQSTGGVLGALEMSMPTGLISVPYTNIYLKWDAVGEVLIDQVDEIFEFNWSLDRKPEPSEVLGKMVIKHNILMSQDLLGDLGRREYWKCICKADVVGK